MGPLVFVVICEAAADFRTATGLVERAVADGVDWIEAGQTEHFFRWQGEDHQYPFWLWPKIDDRARQAGIRVQGHFDDEPGAADARIARRALNYLRSVRQDGQQIDGILLIRDDDGDRDRGVGLEQARKAVPDLSDRIVIGLAHHKRECWVLGGFVPVDERETTLVAELRKQLSFDPIIESHRLTAKADHEVRSAKRVLGRLTGDDWDRQAACWEQTPLVTLRERGEASGLAAFLAEVEGRLVPLFRPDQASPGPGR